jgi:hypothetical protein
MMLAKPARATSRPETRVPSTKAAEPAPRTQPYEKVPSRSAAPSASASASGARAAMALACSTLTPNSGQKPYPTR